MLTGSTRLLTAFLVIGLSAFAIFHGSQLMMFIGTKWTVSAEPKDALSQLGRWFSVPGVSFAARSAAIKNQVDLKILREQLTETVVETPFSSKSWDALAALEFILSEPKERAVQAFTMSAVTAPNELYLMPTRGKIGLALWEALPPERRIGVATDLVTAARENLFDEDRANLLAILNNKSDEVKKDIRQYLLHVDGASPRIMTYLGLPDPGAGSQPK